MAPKWPIFTSKWTTAWHHSLRDASLNTHLGSFDSPTGVEEEVKEVKAQEVHQGVKPESMNCGKDQDQGFNPGACRQVVLGNRGHASKHHQTAIKLGCP
mmetsp:Transcript_101380/g.171609  ORF Transcript_101380/g.171609 Transcript_101380/m.171609 type:complete len:99 (-) Transcript_101380:1597-1893(-)